MKRKTGVYGLLAEFDTVERMHETATRLLIHGYRRVKIYAPYSVKEVSGLFASTFSTLRTMAIAPMVFAGGVGGAVVALFIQEYAFVVDYPMNIGGRPHNSWPAYIPITFVTAILGAALAAAAALLLLNALPRFHNPLFNSIRFERATQDRFFICVEARDRRFDREKTSDLLGENAVAVEEVRW